ncbi:hypothetical protein FB595_1734 [Sphingobium sp. AEW010]|nr:hypothetical protein [Sphingobium sp. JAI105]TWC95476.1 hypothetical protein FB595_1734 [Sphingobium sp. AEW010]TWD14086.1 hypothetical protein FB596_1743 [Sphingobium sp. AEW013]TWD18499.1 hypothetical protein FB594_1733 [Sphingobium sp. AEW001]
MTGANLIPAQLLKRKAVTGAIHKTHGLIRT